MTPSEMIDILGGTTAVAKLLNVKPPSVHGWRAAGIPDDKLIRLAPILEKATGGVVSRRDLRPDDWQSIWPELVDAPPPTRRATDPLPPEAPDRPRRRLPDGKNVTSITDQPATFEKPRP
jgi:DNA-binding transcriptional regulator YdaS (Cro superfamily)